MPELLRIINGALRLDTDKVRNYTAFLAEKLDQDGDAASASRLRKMLEESDGQLRPVAAHFAPIVPVDSESRFPLMERAARVVDEPPLVLTAEQWDTVNEFVSIAKSHALADVSSMSLLMYGPPGTGKGRLARHISQELGLDLYVARLDGLISSFLGSTSKNIRALFDFASKNPCVLFLDEFDAIAKIRGDHQELGELKRVVNSFIQNLDSLGTRSLVIAATNHEELLDAAIWRRFSYRIALSSPTAEQREQLWQHFLAPLNVTADSGETLFAPRDIALLVDLSEGFSGSDIREVCVRLNRRRISLQRVPSLRDAFQILQNLAVSADSSHRFLSALNNKDHSAISEELKHRNGRLYSSSVRGQLLGISKATAHRLAKQAKG